MDGKRLHLPDALRGFAIINVVIYHFLYDIFIIYGLNEDWTELPYIKLWQVLGSGLFILISGMVFSRSRGFWRRGLLLNMLGAAITLFTVLLMPEQAVYYGILTFFGCAVWLLGWLQPLLQKIPAAAGMLLAVFSYLLTMDIDDGYAAVFGMLLWQWPEYLYTDGLALLGFNSPGFYSADYFPLLPNFFVMIFGWFLYRRAEQQGQLALLQKGDIGLLTAAGRHSLLIYLVHQPLLLMLCCAAFCY